jgi:Helix-turn-helix domain
MIENQPENTGVGPGTDPSEDRVKLGDVAEADRILLSLNEAAARLSISPRQMLRMARIQDVAHVDIDGKFYFRPSALTEWVARNEHKAWA